jgi:nuclear protein localization family protein 4
MPTIVVRVRHPKGVLKMELEEQQLPVLQFYERVSTQLASLYPTATSFWLASDAADAEGSRLSPTAGETVTLTHGVLFYLHLRGVSAGGKGPVSESTTKNEPNVLLDAQLEADRGTIKRPKDSHLCRHGEKAMCQHCQPLEPYDAAYLHSQGIKHLSFHSWLRKQRDASTAAVPSLASLLEQPSFQVQRNCPFHAPYPAGLCSKCQPGAVILRQQPFRMLDHVEFAAPRLIDEFLSGWRASGYQRFGWLLGRYARYDGVPLGIKAVVEHIYEPPQDGAQDGFHLLDTEPGSESQQQQHLDHILSILTTRLGLEVVGMMYTDLQDDGSGAGGVLCKRSTESFFVSSAEILFIAHQQALHPCRSLDAGRLSFGSRFATVIATGEPSQTSSDPSKTSSDPSKTSSEPSKTSSEPGQEASASGVIGLKAYQVSEAAVGLAEARLLAATTDPASMLVRAEEDVSMELGEPAYVPEVFYRFRNEYGIEVQQRASPCFPVEYLLVTLTEGIPKDPKPLFPSLPLSFPPPHLHPKESSLADYFTPDMLALPPRALGRLLISANLFVFLQQHAETFFASQAEADSLAEAIKTSSEDRLQAWIEHSESWQRVLGAIAQTTADRFDRPGGKQHVWDCMHCTFKNHSAQAANADSVCEMCSLPQHQ